MNIPSRRRRGLHRFRRIASVSSLGLFVGAAVALTRVFTVGDSPLWTSIALYGATVAYGLGEMAKLRERHLFRPGRSLPSDSAAAWWILRVLLVVIVSTLPAVMLLGGLTAR